MRRNVLTNSIFESAVDQLLDTGEQFCKVAERMGIPYRVVGGLAVFLQVDEIDPIAARLTPDIDVAIDRQDLDRLRSAVEPLGFRHEKAKGLDTFRLIDSRPRSTVHILIIGEKVRPADLEPVPGSAPERTDRGIFFAPVADLVRMKLSSFRLKDKVHIQDMDGVGLITPAIEAELPPLLRERLAEVRATE